MAAVQPRKLVIEQDLGDDIITEGVIRAAFEEMTEVTVVALVKRFKKQLSHPKYKQENRDRFREIIDRIAECISEETKTLRLKVPGQPGAVHPDPEAAISPRRQTFSLEGSKVVLLKHLKNQTPSNVSIPTSETSEDNTWDRETFRARRITDFKKIKTMHDRATIGPYQKRWLKNAAVADVPAMRELLQTYPDVINIKDSFAGYTALHWAARKNNVEMLELLATAPNLALNAQTHGGHTPLHLAKQLGHADMQDRLLKLGARADVADNAGRTLAIMQEHLSFGAPLLSDLLLNDPVAFGNRQRTGSVPNMEAAKRPDSPPRRARLFTMFASKSGSQENVRKGKPTLPHPSSSPALFREKPPVIVATGALKSPPPGAPAFQFDPEVSRLPAGLDESVMRGSPSRIKRTLARFSAPFRRPSGSALRSSSEAASYTSDDS